MATFAFVLLNPTLFAAQQKRARDALCGVVPLGHELPVLNAITAAAVAASGDDFIINSVHPANLRHLCIC